MPSLLFAEHPYVLLFFTTTFRQTIWSSGFPINVNAMIDTLLRKMDVSENDLPYYHYGLVTVLETASVQLFCIFWTAFRNQLTDYLIFYIIFLLMRKYGGGFHFRDFLPCFITSILSLLGILELLQYIRLEILPCTLISSLSLLFIFLIAPVPSIAEDFTTEELRIRKYKLLHIIWIMEVFIIFLAFIKQKHLLHLFMITLLFTSSIMVAGKIHIFYYRKIITKEKTDD